MALTEQEKIEDNSIPEPNSGCWLWLRACTKNWYGQIHTKDTTSNKIEYAHRVSYMAFIGPIPDGAIVRHKCDVSSCVNPDHLEIGAPQDNTNDMIARKRGYWQKQTKCKNGHPIIGPGKCQICRKKYMKKYYAVHPEKFR